MGYLLVCLELKGGTINRLGLLNKNERRAELCTMFLGNETMDTENLFETATREGYVVGVS